MFGDLDWLLNASRRFVSISWASCPVWVSPGQFLDSNLNIRKSFITTFSRVCVISHGGGGGKVAYMSLGKCRIGYQRMITCVYVRLPPPPCTSSQRLYPSLRIKLCDWWRSCLKLSPHPVTATLISPTLGLFSNFWRSSLLKNSYPIFCDKLNIRR